jgi:hypothetical protein
VKPFSDGDAVTASHRVYGLAIDDPADPRTRIAPIHHEDFEDSPMCKSIAWREPQDQHRRLEENIQRYLLMQLPTTPQS